MIENKKETYQLIVGQSVDKIKALKKVSKNVEERQKENKKGRKNVEIWRNVKMKTK